MEQLKKNLLHAHFNHKTIFKLNSIQCLRHTWCKSSLNWKQLIHHKQNYFLIISWNGGDDRISFLIIKYKNHKIPNAFFFKGKKNTIESYFLQRNSSFKSVLLKKKKINQTEKTSNPSVSNIYNVKWQWKVKKNIPVACYWACMEALLIHETLIHNLYR